MSFDTIANVIGGLGLFMVGMRMMTSGLKQAAGPSLKQMLAQWTGTRLRGVLSGTFITALVQSSSAVSVATIGFVNAGLMNLNQAIHILYGANIGTTFTGWIVALVGFHFNIKILALPAIGIGMGIKMLFAKRRIAMFAEALAGFGIFFLGIEILKLAFTYSSSDFQFEMRDAGLSQVMAFFAIGFLLTTVMQSSSAVIAMTLTSVGGGLLSLNVAAAIAIGANVGTTSTAALAVIGATANAKRVAAGQIIFNLLTGLIALIILGPLLSISIFINGALGLGEEPASSLAIFDTIFNILGVILIWPFTSKLVGTLEKCFQEKKEEKIKAKYLEKMVLKTPNLALTSTLFELQRISNIAYNMVEAALSNEEGSLESLEADRESIKTLEEAIVEYLTALQRDELSPEVASSLPIVLRVMGYLSEIADLSLIVASSQATIGAIGDSSLSRLSSYKIKVINVIDDFKNDIYSINKAEFSKAADEVFEEYEVLKKHLLEKTTRGELNVKILVAHLDLLTALKRIVERSERELDYLSQVLKYEEFNINKNLKSAV